jgi:chromosome segregation ATPase
MTIEERIAFFVNEKNDVQKKIEAVDAKIASLHQQRETLNVSYHRIDGALSALYEIKNESDMTMRTV